ncbi:sensor histidine kinase [Pseudoalteromonas atlantica]|uniref:sensor histidine kinase n=1 Tax=Pseudoalteromonas atlantica TaxID=288 RepID=UPI0037356693
MSKFDALPIASKKGLVVKSIFSLFINFLIVWLVFEQVYQREINAIKSQQDEKLVTINNEITREVSSIEKLTKILAQGPILKKDALDSASSLYALRPNINDYLSNFAVATNNISQIRWIDSQGQERFRVDINDNQSTIVQQRHLQNKKNRYYFIQGMQVAAPDTYTSAIDLNVERGKIVKPHQPTIRVTYRTNREKYLIDGLLVVNFNLNYLFSDIQQYNQKTSQVSLLNQSGFWLLHKDPALEWGFMYNNSNNTLASQSPELWSTIVQSEIDSNSVLMDDTLYTYRLSLLSLLENKSNESKKIIILLNSRNGQIINEKEFAAQLAIILGLLLSLISFGLIYRDQKYQNKLLTLSHKLNIEKVELGIVNRQFDATIKQQQRLQASLIEARKLSSLGLLVAGVAHEMNTPIGGAIISVSNADMALKKLNNAVKEGLTKSMLDETMLSIDENLTLAKTNLDKTAVLVKSFKKMAIDRHTDELVLCDIEKLIKELLISLNSRLKNSPIKIRTQFLTNKQIVSRSGIISQVIENLIMNALSHAFEESQTGEVEIKVELNDDKGIILTISDNGCGISDEVKNNILEPFYTTARGKGNTGLGLYMVHQWVTEVLHGELILDSDPDSDDFYKTQFIITIPDLG